MNIKAAVVEKPGDPFVIDTVTLAEPRDDELLVKVAACGFCHTDELARTNRLPVVFPAVFGHEGSGIVIKAGSKVREFSEGDHVTFSFDSCGICAKCLEGKPTLCRSFTPINFFGARDDKSHRLSRNGQDIPTFFGQSAFATYAIVSERSAVAVPRDFPLELAAPLGCGIQTGAGAVLNRLKPRPGSSIVVFGCGSVGLSAIMACKIAGCAEIIGVDIVSSRLELAASLGATHVINSKETENVVGEIIGITGDGADASVDATGNGICTRMALNCLAIGGSAAVIGGGGDMTLNVEIDLMGVSKSLLGVVEGDSNPKLFIPELIAHYKAGRFPFDKLISYYDFEEIETAAADSHNGKAVKAVLKMS